MKHLLSVILSFALGSAIGAPVTDSLSIRLSELEPAMGTEAYIPAWYALKARLDKSGCSKADYLELYRQKNNHHYYAGELDSLKRYVPLVQQFCLDEGKINAGCPFVPAIPA